MKKKENIRYNRRNSMSMKKEMTPKKSVHVEMRLAEEANYTHQYPIHVQIYINFYT